MDKNGFVFLPMFFAGQLSNLKYLEEAIIGFITFSFAATSIYCLNDVIDVERLIDYLRLRDKDQ